jgi:hypothetical protein
MHARERFEDIVRRLEACKLELQRQDQVWRAAQVALQEAGEVQFAFESLPQQAAPLPLTPTHGIRG